MEQLTAKVENIIKQESESDWYDFKRQWYKKKDKDTDLLTDILCFANTVHDHDCYIIIGVTDDYQIVGAVAQVLAMRLNTWVSLPYKNTYA